MAKEIRDAIEDNAQQPRHVNVDGVDVEQHPLKDQVEADRYLSSKTGVGKPTRGLRFNVMKPPGAAGCSRS